MKSCFYGKEAKEHIEYVLSYAPYKKWHAIITKAESNNDKTYFYSLVEELLAVDSLSGPFTKISEAIEKLQNVIKNIEKLPTTKHKTKLIYFSKALEASLVHRNYLNAFDFFMKALELDKTDLFMCKKAQLMALFGGFNYKILEPCLLIKDFENNLNQKYFPGMLVFGYEQQDNYKQAETIALQYLNSEKHKTDIWLIHGFA